MDKAKKGKKKKKKAAKPPKLTWREQLSTINPSEVRKGCEVEFSMLIEYFPKYFNSTQKLQFFTYLNATLKLQCIIYEEIVYIIKHYPAWNRPYLDDNIEAILKQAVDEAKPFLKTRSPIPLELTAQLIKLRVIMAVQEHVYSCSLTISERTSVSSVESGLASSIFTEEELVDLEEPMVEHVSEEEHTTMTPTHYNQEDTFGNIADIDEDFYSRSSLELRGYIERLRLRRQEFVKKSGGEKRSPRSSDSVPVGLPKNCRSLWSIKHLKWKRQETKGTDTNKTVVLDEKERSLHLVLTGFYEPALIEELSKVGLTMTCLIGLTRDGDVSTEPIFLNKTYSSETRHVPIYNYTLHHANPGLKNFLCTSYYKELVLYHCYEGLEELFDSKPTLQDIIYFRCEPTIESDGQDKDVYERVCNLVQEIPRLKTLHSDYLGRIELRPLGASPKAIPASLMTYYNSSLNKVPPDCFSVSLLLDGLLEEVCQRSSPNAPEQERAKVFRKYKFNRVPKNPAQFLSQNLMVDLQVDLSRFVVHEKNIEEMSLRYYPQVKKKLLDVNLTYLELSRPALLWRKYWKAQKKTNLTQNQFLTWASELRLPPEELTTCLQVYMFNLLACPKAKEDAGMSCDVQKYFRNPFKTTPTIKMNATVDEEEPKLRWQEDLSCKTMLQEIRKASLKFTCMDHMYVPFMDVICLRFHDNPDDFGLSTETWNEMLRTPVGLHDFFKWVVYQDEESTRTPSLECPTLIGYDFGKWRGINGVSTLFRSSEGFSIRVDKEWCFNRVPSLSICFETRGHSLHLNTATHTNGLMFHFLLANGCRILFAKPEDTQLSENKSCEGYRRSSPKTPAERNPIYYLVKKTSYVYFKDRHRYCKAQLLTKASLQNVLHRSSTLSEIDSQRSIDLTPKPSTTTIWNTRNRGKIKPKRIRMVFNQIKAYKRALTPHFKICSSILHRYKYVKVAKECLTINFANFTKTIKFIPHVKLKYRVEISPCFYLPPRNTGQTLDAIYDIRVSLPSGLQVQIMKGVPPHAYHIVQYYATGKGPMCRNIESEVSRTYLRTGFVCIKYADGSLKMHGVNGMGAKCEAPFIAGLRQRARQRKLRRLIDRYQGKFVDDQHKHYLRRFKGGWKNRIDADLKELCAKIGSAEFVTSDGQKFLVSKRRRVGVKINLEVSDSTFSQEEKVGAHTSIDQNGELTTVYPDGTRITSWYRVDQEMVVIYNDPLSGELELDEDDYLCNFLIPRWGGWISVQLYYQFEHPNYATVTYGGGENCMQLRLPNRTELRTQRKGFSLNVKEQLFADIFATSITLHSNYCRKCYDSCATKFNIKHLYENSKPLPTNECLLIANDNFGKVFRVLYDGRWSCNTDYKPGKVKHDCLTHRKDESQKFYVWKRDLSGKVFWDQDLYLNRMMVAQYGKMQRVKYYLDDKGELIAYEFLKYVRQHYCQRFLIDYGPPDPPIFKPPKPHEDNLFKTIAFTKRRLIKILPNCEKNPSVHDTEIIWPSFTAEDFARWVSKIEGHVAFDDNISLNFPCECKLNGVNLQRVQKGGRRLRCGRRKPTEKVERVTFPKTNSFAPITPTNSPYSLVSDVAISQCQSETDQINLFASMTPRALLIQDDFDFISETRSFTCLNSSEVLKLGKHPRPQYKDKSTGTTTRFDLFCDDWRIAPSETSLPPPISEDATVKENKFRKKEFVCKKPTYIEPPVKRPKAKATSTTALEAFCKCRRSMRGLIQKNSRRVTSEFVKKPKPDSAALQMHSKYAQNIPAAYKRVIKCNQIFYKQLEHELLKADAKSQARVSNQDLSHLRRDSWESVFSQEVQSTLPTVLPATTSEDSCKILLAPKSAVVTKSEKKFVRPFRSTTKPKEEEEDSYQQIGNLTPQSFDVFVKTLRQRLRKIEEVDASDDIAKKIGEDFDLLINEEDVPFFKKITTLQDLLKQLRSRRKDVDSMRSSVTDMIISK